MAYFERFPNMIYDMKNDGNYKLLPDILRRVKQRNAIASGQFIFDTYDVKNGEKPEDIAYKWFGDAQLHWVILMTNNAVSVSFREYEERLQDKYRSIKLLNQRFLSDFLEEFNKLIKE